MTAAPTEDSVEALAGDAERDQAIEAAAERLATANASRRPCAPVRDLLPTGDVDIAYAVQAAGRDARTAAGAHIVGRKVGLTNTAVQIQLGVEQPDFGWLFDDMACASATSVDLARLLQPRIETEVAFVLRRDLDDEGAIDVVTVRSAIDHAVAAFEIVDSRIAGWDIQIVDTVADNGSCGLFVLGDVQVDIADFDPSEVTMIMKRSSADGAPAEVVSTGRGVDCLGDPLAALAWLATAARDRGAPLRAGEIVLSGALGPMVPVAAGDRFDADLTGLGAVAVSFNSPAQEFA